MKNSIKRWITIEWVRSCDSTDELEYAKADKVIDILHEASIKIGRISHSRGDIFYSSIGMLIPYNSLDDVIKTLEEKLDFHVSIII